jgi:hypothetical protein
VRILAKLSAHTEGQPNGIPGFGLKLFGFIAEPVFAFAPKPCSRSQQARRSASSGNRT